jgi:simple sugar transport system permease protein
MVLKRNKWTQSVLAIVPSLLAIIAGLLLGFLILVIVNPNQALEGIAIILKGGLNKGMTGMGQVLYFATPIIMTGLAVGFAFKTGLFNIGASGQFAMGAFAAIYVGVTMKGLPPSIHWLVAVLAAMLAGAIWGFLPGFLKAVRNVNEVITSIMMNYIGMSSINIMIRATVYNKLKNETLPVATSANIPTWGLNQIFPYPSMNGGILIAIACVVIVYIILEKTTFGYELKACGFNKDAGLYAGINAKRNMVYSMMISGALAGIGGGLLYLSGSGKYMKVIDMIATEGFDGISVSLLGMSHPIGILFAGVFIAYIKVGGFNLQLLNYDQEIINIITAAIIYFSAFALLFRNRIQGFLTRGENSKVDIEPEVGESQ